jgi:hypothetical protein
MKNTKRFLSFTAIFCVGLFAFGFAQEASAQVLAKKTIDRWVDTAVVDGKILKELNGKPLEKLRLYAYNNGTFEPIRFQVDEMTEDGDWILPEGPRPNNDLSNGTFDSWDKLLFMADDSGDKASEDVWTKGYSQSEEIEIIDPLTGEKGWVYLLYFATNPPAKCAKPDYLHFKYSLKNARLDCELHDAEYIETTDGKVATYYDLLSIPVVAGGSGKNFVDRLKIRIRLSMMMGSVNIKMNEEQLRSDIIAWKNGPVRWTRRSEQYRKVPGGLKVLRVVADTNEHRATATTPVFFDIPFKMDTIFTSFVVRFGNDYSEEVLGSMAYSSTNPEGFLVDGKMDAKEKTYFNPQLDEWRLMTGKFGTTMARTLLTPEIKKNIKITMGIIDDLNQSYPPERNPGTIGYVWQDWDATSMPKGRYHLFVEIYYPPHYKKGDEVKYVNYIDNPIKFRVNGQEQKNMPLILPNVGKRYQGTVKFGG